MADSNSSPEQRVTDAEREQTIHLLKRHTGMERLTLEELSDRAGMAWAARTKGDLEELVRDLRDDHLRSRGAQPDRRCHRHGKVRESARCWRSSSDSRKAPNDNRFANTPTLDQGSSLRSRSRHSAEL